MKKLNLIEKNLTLGKLAEKMEELLIIADKKGKFEYINPAEEKILGLEKKKLLKKNCFKLLFIPEEIIKLEENTTRFVTYHKPDKVKVILELKISFIKLPSKTKVIIIGTDLTKKLEFEKEKETLLYQDPLTGLLNRSGFIKKCLDF